MIMNADDIYAPTTDTTEYDEFASMWAAEERESGVSFDEMGLTDDELVDNQGYGDDNITRDLLDHSERLAEEAVTTQMENAEVFAQNFEQLPDDIAFSIGDQRLTKSELVKMAENNVKVQEASGNLANFYNAMEQQEQFFKERAYAVTLESDRYIANIKRELDSNYSTPARKGELYEQLQRYESQRSMVNHEAEQFTAKMQDAKIRAATQNVEAIKVAMAHKYSDWNNVREEYGTYLQGSGVDFKTLAPLLSPQLADVFMKAMKYDKTIKNEESKVASKLNKQPQRSRPVIASSKVQKVVKQPNAEIIKGITSGSLHPDAWFDALED